MRKELSELFRQKIFCAGIMILLFSIHLYFYLKEIKHNFLPSNTREGISAASFLSLKALLVARMPSIIIFISN